MIFLKINRFKIGPILMNLQNRMIKIIAERLGGRYNFINYLEKCKRQSAPSDKYCFDNLLYYMNAMYEFEVDFEGDTLKYFDKTRDHIVVFQKYYARNGCVGLGLIIELLCYNLEYVSNLRRLA